MVWSSLMTAVLTPAEAGYQIVDGVLDKGPSEADVVSRT